MRLAGGLPSVSGARSAGPAALAAQAGPARQAGLLGRSLALTLRAAALSVAGGSAPRPGPRRSPPSGSASVLGVPRRGRTVTVPVATETRAYQTGEAQSRHGGPGARPGPSWYSLAADDTIRRRPRLIYELGSVRRPPARHRPWQCSSLRRRGRRGPQALRSDC